MTHSDGTQTKMITTVAGAMPLDFNNTKMIQDGKVKILNEHGTISCMTAVKQMASYNKDGSATMDTARSYATDIGLFKAGMDQID